MGIFGAVFGGIGSVFFGSSHSTTNYGTPVDYSPVMQYESDNNKVVSLAQIKGQEMTLQQTHIDREMQNGANLELGIEKLDTHLQTSKLDYIQQMAAEENKHAEKMFETRQKHASLERGGSQAYIDLPEPS